MIIGREPLDLNLTLMESAQCFHWILKDGWYGGVLNGRPVWLRATEAGIEARGEIGTQALRHYLDLDRDYGQIAREYAGLPAASRAMALFPGLRVLNQSPWETLVAFILSANNNVARIRGLTQALCARFGEMWNFEGITLYGFPSPERLANAGEGELRALKVGYRAPFLIGAAQRVLEGFPLESLRDMPYEAAHAALTVLPGVGDKVADCVLLFGCGHTSAFPVDVWVERLLRSWFDVRARGRAAMLREARALLGEHAGLLQQFLFHAARTGAIELD